MAQQKKLSIFVLFVIVLQNIDNANTECIGIEVKLFIRAEYLESSVREDFKHTTNIQTSSTFKSNYKKLAVSASVSGSGAGFSGSASASYEAVTDSALENSGSSHKEKKTMTKFDDGQNQIIRKILTRVTIDGLKAQTITSDIVDSVNENDSPSPEKLRNWAADYINYTYGDKDGNHDGIRKNTYTETTCVQVSEIIDPFELVEENTECRTTNQRHLRKPICDGNCRSPVNRGAQGVANCFQLLQADDECGTLWFEVGHDYCACYKNGLQSCTAESDDYEDLYRIRTV